MNTVAEVVRSTLLPDFSKPLQRGRDEAAKFQQGRTLATITQEYRE
jgi:hypothetical protein